MSLICRPQLQAMATSASVDDFKAKALFEAMSSFLGGKVSKNVLNDNKKDRWDSGKPRRQQIRFCDIQIKVAISCRHIYIYTIQICYHSKSQ